MTARAARSGSSANAGSILCFSGAQLHSTVPSVASHTRFSFDFRTVHIDDVAAHRGPANVDARCTGTTLRDFLRADTHVQLPEELIAEYDEGGSQDGVLVFDPAVLEELTDAAQFGQIFHGALPFSHRSSR